MGKTCNRHLHYNDHDPEGCGSICCDLPRGHKGPHQNHSQSKENGKVLMQFDRGMVPVLVERLKHIIPQGERASCRNEDGTKNCPFSFRVGNDDDLVSHQCYLFRWSQGFFSDAYDTCDWFRREI